MPDFRNTLRSQVYRLTHPGKPRFTCPVCSYKGPFKDKQIRRLSHLLRLHSKCPQCGATERHRMLYLVLKEVLGPVKKSGNKILHIAPEPSLKTVLSEHYEVYHTSDLYRTDVDFNEDIQAMSFPDGSYDAVIESRVLTIPENLGSSVKELRRILKPGGMAIIAEMLSLEATQEFGQRREEHSRELGIDLIPLFESSFERVDLFISDRYPKEFQLNNLMRESGKVVDDFPEMLRCPKEGLREIVFVCTA